MSAHCECSDAERDPYVREEEIRIGPPEPVVSQEEICGNCGGLIEVLGSRPLDEEGSA